VVLYFYNHVKRPLAYIEWYSISITTCPIAYIEWYSMSTTTCPLAYI
jgi:hypothetical protein